MANDAPGKDASVLVVAHHFTIGFGGVPESILLLARSLRSSGIHVDVLCRDGFFPAVGKLESLPAAGEGMRWRDTLAFDPKGYASIFVAGAWNRLALALALRARYSGIPVIYSPKGNLAWAEFKRFRDIKKFPYLLSAELLLLGLADSIVVSSRLERQNLVAPGGAFDKKISVAPELFEGPPLTEKRVKQEGPLVFGFLAEIAPRKGLRELVRAFIEWQAEAPLSAQLHVAGAPRPASERYLASVVEEAKRSRVANEIVFRGALRGADRDRFYDEIDFLVCPTYFESFGLTVLESLWHGTPALATRNMGVLEFLPEGAPVIEAASNGAADLVAALRAAAQQRDRYALEAAQWRARLISALSGASTGRKFAELLGCRRARPAQVSQ